MSTVIISGDIEAPTTACVHRKKLAATLGISRYFAETLPEDKANLIEQLQAAPEGHDKGKTVCFVGDGINDSIAMKKAQVSISLSGASTVATDTAGIILMDGTGMPARLHPFATRALMPHAGVRIDIGQDFKNNLEKGIA